MLTQSIWWVPILLECMILFRALRGKILLKYPFFYAYIASVLIFDVVCYFLYMARPDAYAGWYWTSGLLTLIVGYGVILEVFRHVLSAYPGAEKFARVAGLVIFVAIFCFAILYPLAVPGASKAGSHIDLRRDFKTVQAIFLFAILGVVSYYGIPLGRNLKGMTFGYALCLGVSIIALALRSYIGPSFDTAWAIVQPFSFDVSLLVWVIALWAYHPNPAADSSTSLEADYDVFAEKTRGTIGAMRSYLGKAARP
jgi:hypothetical protein